MIKLINNTIEQDDIAALIEWLQKFPHLTKGTLTIEFEELWSRWLGCKYSVFVNSGSSANLLMLYALKTMGRLKNDKVIVPAVSWSTTVAPVMQLGLTPILCDCELDGLGVDPGHFEELCVLHDPAALILVHVLGFPCNMKEIMESCSRFNVCLLEDSCESMGSSVDGVKTGNFGDVSSFSLYFGHIISSVEGGIVCTNDREVYNCLKMLRSHGWDRDLSESGRSHLRDEYEVDEFRGLYTFYVPGFNLRATDIQAFLALRQMEKIDGFIARRKENYRLYDGLIKNGIWKPNPIGEFVNFAYPVISPFRDEIVSALVLNEVETRPLICGSIGHQPFWTDKYGQTSLEFADFVHEGGLYLPNNHELEKSQIRFICDVVNGAIGAQI